MSRPSEKRRPHSKPASQHRKKRAEPANAGRSTQQAKWIWAAVGAVLVAGIIVVAISGTSTRTAAAGVRDPEAIAAGAELYAASCASCHGTDLDGTDTGPPFLNVIYAPNHHADEAFQRAVAGGVQPHHWNFGPMVPVDGLDRSEVALIVEYIRSVQEAEGILRDPSH